MFYDNNNDEKNPPHDIQLSILSFFNQRQLAQVRRVNKTWCAMTQDVELLKKAKYPLLDYTRLLLSATKIEKLPSPKIFPEVKSNQKPLPDGGYMRLEEVQNPNATTNKIIIKNDKNTPEKIFCDGQRFISPHSFIKVNGAQLTENYITSTLIYINANYSDISLERNIAPRMFDVIQLNNASRDIVTSCYDGYILIWDRESGYCKHIFTHQEGSFGLYRLGLFALSNGNFIVTQSNGVAHLWSAEKRIFGCGLNATPTCMAELTHGDVAVGLTNGYVSIIDGKNGEYIYTFDTRLGAIRALTALENGNFKSIGFDCQVEKTWTFAFKDLEKDPEKNFEDQNKIIPQFG